jgi:hypothetical protein
MPRAPRIFVEPDDFAPVAELARAISGCSRVCICLSNPETSETRLTFFPALEGVSGLPASMGRQRLATVRVVQEFDTEELAALGLPKLAYWAGFALKSTEGRSLGVLGVMDERPVDLAEPVLAQLGQLAEVLSRGIGMAASTIRTLARQSLGLIEDIAELQKDVPSPAMTGLLRYAAGRVPSPGETVAMRKAGLADLVEGTLMLSPMARDMLYIHGFRLANPRPAGPDAI